jgi:hypothetical protein
MELIERYLQSVRFWLPKTKQQEGILTELGDDLRSQVEEKEAELKRPLDQHEVAEILKRCGQPMIVAGRLSPKRYLIGPTLFPIYLFVLRMVLLWILVPVFIFIVAPTNAVRSGDWGTAIANTLGDLWSGLFIAAGVITLVFTILERTHAQLGMECKWDPMKLPPIRKHERKPSTLQMVCELAFNWFGLIWLLLLPHNPVLLFGPAAAFLKPGSLWDTFYIPVVAVTCFAIFRIGLALSKPQWTWLPPLGQLIQSLLGIVIVKYMLAAAGRITPGQWHPFVVLRDRASAPIAYVHVASIVNASLYISLICVWIGLCIAIAIQAWQLMRNIRKEHSSREHTAPVQVQ